MNFIGILIALPIFTAIFGTYRAITTADSSPDSQSWNRSKPKSPRLHFVSKEINISSRTSEPHHLVFHLQGIGPSNERAKDSPKTLGLSLSELEKCIPWIPMDSAIFISSGEGFGPMMLNRIKSLETSRDLYLIDGRGSNEDKRAWAAIPLPAFRCEDTGLRPQEGRASGPPAGEPAKPAVQVVGQTPEQRSHALFGERSLATGAK